MKAFFSYSSNDQAIVHAVAGEVGRAFVTIDTAALQTADDLIKSIESAIRDSAMFVYFVSRASLESEWVNFEVDEARYRQSMNRLRKFIVVLLDDRLEAKDFPEWMRRYVFVKNHAPRPIARVIRGVIDEMVGEEQSRFFVGRAVETARLQAALVPPDSSSRVAIVTIRGLPGIGRRTLLQRVARDSLFIDRLLTVRIEVGDSVNSITVKLANLVEPVVSLEETLEMAEEIKSMLPAAACSRFVSDVNRALQLHELVVLYDDGGILDNNGFPTLAVQSILQETEMAPGLLVALVTNRRPRFEGTPLLEESVIVDVNPLHESEIRQLIALKARAKDLNLAHDMVVALAEQAKGYPPAATALVELAHVYGPHLRATFADGTKYSPRPLTRYLARLVLSPAERKMISILARNSPLPLEVLVLFAKSPGEAANALTRLIDLSLVIPQQGTSWYRISDPVIDYIDRVRELLPCTPEDYATVANVLDKFLGEDRDAGAYLDLSRVLYRALVHAGEKERPRAYALLADWLRLAEDFYHQRNYQKALDLVSIAHKEARSSEALAWIIRCNVKLGNVSQALLEIDELRSFGQLRDVYFLRGFLERNRGSYYEAVKYYERARQAGWTGMALERDLAESYFQTGDIESATKYIKAAQSRQSDNRYVLSLRIKIACYQDDEDTARGLLKLLKQVDSPIFFAHRSSLVELTFGNINAATDCALEATRAASRGGSRPPAEALANLAHCQILMNLPREAIETLEKLESLYGYRWNDALNGLRAKAAVLERRYEDALNFIRQMTADTDADAKISNMKLERDALKGLLGSTFLAPDVRHELEQRHAELERRLAASGDRLAANEHYWDFLGD